MLPATCTKKTSSRHRANFIKENCVTTDTAHSTNMNQRMNPLCRTNSKTFHQTNSPCSLALLPGTRKVCTHSQARKTPISNMKRSNPHAAPRQRYNKPRQHLYQNHRMSTTQFFENATEKGATPNIKINVDKVFRVLLSLQQYKTSTSLLKAGILRNMKNENMVSSVSCKIPSNMGPGTLETVGYRPDPCDNIHDILSVKRHSEK